MEELIQLSFDPCEYNTTKPLKLSEFIDNFAMEIIHYEVIDTYDEGDYQSLVDYNYTVKLTYLPTNKSMNVGYIKFRFEDKTTLKTNIIKHLHRECKKFDTGIWEKNEDKIGTWYVNTKLQAKMEDKYVFDSWQKQTNNVKDILGDSYDSFIKSLV